MRRNVSGSGNIDLWHSSGVIMSKFVLNNKLSGKAHFELGECPIFDLVPDCGVIPMPAILEARIGSEMALYLIDKTPFIYTLAKVKPFDLMLKTGMVATDHGPVAFLLIYVPNPASPDDPYFAYDYHLNPFDAGMIAAFRDLARQSHWHLILVDADRQVQGVMEFGNVYHLGEALDKMTKAIEGWKPGNFALAKQQFSDQYSLKDLFELR
jgi:hypothetical protein